MSDVHKLYRNTISEVLAVNPDSIYLYWKGRVALYALLKAVGLGEGDEVLISGLTCVVVPNSIIYADAKPIYVDVSTETYNPDYKSYIKKVSDKTKVIIIQNTFGLSSDVEEIVKYAKEHDIVTIEDCTHGFGGIYNGKPNGSYCDAAFYSTQWNKPFSTGIGGFCLVNNPDLIPGLKQVNKRLIEPGMLQEFMLSFLFWAKGNLLNDTTFWILRNLYRRLSKAGIVLGSSQSEELVGTHMPVNFFMSASEIQSKYGIKSLKKIYSCLKKRKEISLIYSDFLSRNNKKSIPEMYFENHSFLVYPIIVRNRAVFFAKAEKYHIQLGDWFVSPIHPVTENYNIWFLDKENVPNASYLSKHMVNLPTLTENVENVLSFLKNNIDDIL